MDLKKLIALTPELKELYRIEQELENEMIEIAHRANSRTGGLTEAERYRAIGCLDRMKYNSKAIENRLTKMRSA